MADRGELRIGTSGYQYKHWRGVFYPQDLPTSRWFEYYAERFDTVEINNTFYRLPEEKVFDQWHDQAPANFRYVLKFSRFGSHMKKLKDPDNSLGHFVPRAERLKSFLGPTLVQLPPGWGVNVERLDAFLSMAPRRMRWTVEFRDRSWLCEEVYQTLRRHQAALCVHDMIQDHPRLKTADWMYLRFHGGHYDQDYSTQFLTAEARRIKELLADGADVYAYFNNDAHGYAVRNALDLRRYVLGQ